MLKMLCSPRSLASFLTLLATSGASLALKNHLPTPLVLLVGVLVGVVVSILAFMATPHKRWAQAFEIAVSSDDGDQAPRFRYGVRVENRCILATDIAMIARTMLAENSTDIREVMLLSDEASDGVFVDVKAARDLLVKTALTTEEGIITTDLVGGVRYLGEGPSGPHFKFTEMAWKEGEDMRKMGVKMAVIGKSSHAVFLHSFCCQDDCGHEHHALIGFRPNFQFRVIPLDEARRCALFGPSSCGYEPGLVLVGIAPLDKIASQPELSRTKLQE